MSTCKKSEANIICYELESVKHNGSVGKEQAMAQLRTTIYIYIYIFIFIFI